ncbi:YaiO family outer membrane beta-barrel protein [Labilibaculum sp. DW002]|uniref:YaiO family outer membrane beta-barrel protein n=1 Tax=Paralabilibaculum antarcticum TaxID=2912572 RepID=A0ABT5VRR2_9BACT|nr:YaiO family outer membrane beta-barrel protein [Labilibaculum sp. DW002]MDE5417208.1 YaiO family outer membrane beta-barrel protein [Labilibaculum sp. DW002]
MIRILSLFIVLLNVICLVNFASAQNDIGKIASVSGEFQRAKELAFSGKKAEARSICYRILEENPKYYDARILIGRTFSWEKNFDSARVELDKVLKEDLDNKDAVMAMIDLESWAGNPSKAIFYCEYGQSFFPNDELFLVKKAKLYQNTGNDRKSMQTLDELLELNPGSEEGVALLKKYRSSKMIYKAVYKHDFEYFNEPYERRWHLSSFQLARRNSWGSLIAKINLGDLISSGESFWSNEVSKQFELDAYPKISKKSYAYLSYGYSPDNLFPRHRAGAELYRKLPKSFEISAGLRFLQFDSDSGSKDIYIYTASLGKYYRNYWFNFRTYLTPKNSEVSQSYWLSVRRYLRNAKNYFGLQLGTGVSPDEPKGNISSFDTYNYKSQKIRLSYQDRLFTDRFIYLLRLGYEKEEYLVDVKRDVISLSLKLSYQF